jgi:hypothetical protein
LEYVGPSEIEKNMSKSILFVKMESVKHPGTIIAGIDAVAIVGLGTWTYRQFAEVREQITKSSNKVDELVSKLSETLPKIHSGVQNSDRELTAQHNLIRKNDKKIAFLEDKISGLEEQLSLLMELLVEKTTFSENELQKKVLTPPGRIFKRTKAKPKSRRDDSSDESEEELQRTRPKGTSKSDDDVAAAVSAARSGSRSSRL